MSDLLANYRAFIDKVEESCSAILAGWGSHIRCRSGCDECCRLATVLPVEAAAIALAIAELKPELREHLRRQARGLPTADTCPLLHQGKCTIYAWRPVICRTHGFPLLFRDEHNAMRVDYCRQNFQGIAELSAQAIIDLERLNQIQIGINRLYCRESGIGDGERVSLKSIL